MLRVERFHHQRTAFLPCRIPSSDGLGNLLAVAYGNVDLGPQTIERELPNKTVSNIAHLVSNVLCSTYEPTAFVIGHSQDHREITRLNPFFLLFYFIFTFSLDFTPPWYA